MTDGSCLIQGCPRPLKARGWCGTHYARWCQHGDPLMVMSPTPRLLDERFWEKVGAPNEDGCREWLGSKNPAGYGTFHMGGHFGRPELAHRMALELSGVEVPRGVLVCHHCDNPPCCEPSHLYVGTHSDNVRDMWTRGRGRSGFPTKLTDDDVRAIRLALGEGIDCKVLAADYGVTAPMIRTRERRQWVTDIPDLYSLDQ